MPGSPDSALPGPYPVGEYAAALRARLRSFARVQLVGELVNLRTSRARVYFELRDADGRARRARAGARTGSALLAAQAGRSRRGCRW